MKFYFLLIFHLFIY